MIIIFTHHSLPRTSQALHTKKEEENNHRHTGIAGVVLPAGPPLYATSIQNPPARFCVRRVCGIFCVCTLTWRENSVYILRGILRGIYARTTSNLYPCERCCLYATLLILRTQKPLTLPKQQSSAKFHHIFGIAWSLGIIISCLCCLQIHIYIYILFYDYYS